MPSQRPSTQSSSGPSRRRREPSSESEGSDAGDGATQQETQGGGGGRGGLSLTQIQHCASQLIRLALFYEYQHKVIRRDLIIQKVIPPNAKNAFNIVFSRAQTVLRQKFGMELYELRPKGKGAGAAGTDGVETQTQAQTQAQTQKKRGRPSRLDVIDEEEEDDDDGDEAAAEDVAAVVKQPGSKTYIVRSILSPELRELLATPHPLNNPAEERGDEDDYVDSGALLPLDKADGTASGSIQLLGLRTVIMSLVMCMGRVIADDHLHSLLKRLHLYRDTILPYTSPDGKDATMTLDKYLDLLDKQQYLEKVKIVSQVGIADAAQFEWRWGNREAELSETAVQEWMTRLMAGEADEEEDEDEHPRDRRGVERRRKRQEERAQKVNQIRGDIVKAAGGPLNGDL